MTLVETFDQFQSSLPFSDFQLNLISAIATNELSLHEVFETPLCWGSLLEILIIILETAFTLSEIEELERHLKSDFADINELCLFLWKISLLHLNEDPLGSLTEAEKSFFIQNWSICIHVTLQIFLTVDFTPQPVVTENCHHNPMQNHQDDTFKYQIDMCMDTCRYYSIASFVEQYYDTWYLKYIENLALRTDASLHNLNGDVSAGSSDFY